MSVLVASIAIALALAILAYGVFLSFRILNFPDITADGSFPLGAAVAATLIDQGSIAGMPVGPWTATAIATCAGAAAGLCTGIVHAYLRVNVLLSGILTMTALYSVNLMVMGRSNIGLYGKSTIFTPWERAVEAWAGGSTLPIMGRPVPAGDVAAALLGAALAAAIGVALWLFLRTQVGAAMRATGDNPRMLRALGTSTSFTLMVGMGCSNALIALSGAVFGQLQGFADAQMGIGIIVLGLASVIIGQTLVGAGAGIGLLIVGAVMGTVLFRLLVAIALRMGLDPNNLKLITAVVVLAALVLPGLMSRAGSRLRWGVAR
jgi:putative ABC transport system permease protein